MSKPNSAHNSKMRGSAYLFWKSSPWEVWYIFWLNPLKKKKKNKLSESNPSAPTPGKVKFPLELPFWKTSSHPHYSLPPPVSIVQFPPIQTALIKDLLKPFTLQSRSLIRLNTYSDLGLTEFIFLWTRIKVAENARVTCLCTSALLTGWAGRCFVVGAMLGIIGCLTASLASAH